MQEDQPVLHADPNHRSPGQQHDALILAPRESRGILYVVGGVSVEQNGVYLSSLDGKENRRVLADVSPAQTGPSGRLLNHVARPAVAMRPERAQRTNRSLWVIDTTQADTMLHVVTPEARTLSKRFLTAYNQLDEYMRRQLNLAKTPNAVLLAKMANESPFLARNQQRLEVFAKLRNLIIHESTQEADPIAEPHEHVVEEYEEIVRRLLHPPRALDVAVPVTHIFTTDLDRCVLDVIAIMNAKVYTHVPIMDEDRLVGVFSENTLVSYLVARGGANIVPETKVREFHDFVPLEKHASEVFEFLGQDATVVDLGAKFQHIFKKNKRLAAVFITDSGRESGRLLGMVTAWDMAGADLR